MSALTRLCRILGTCTPAPVRSRVLSPLFARLLGAREMKVGLADCSASINCTPSSFIENQVLLTGYFEKEESRFISRTLRPGMHALDVGANVGIHAMRMAAAVGVRGRVSCFEPNPEVRFRLERNIALNAFTNIEVHPVGISEQTGKAILYVNDLRDWNRSATMVRDPDAQSSIPVSVDVCQLDALFSVEKVDFIKVDVDGLDLPVLRSAMKILATHRPVVLFEYSPHFLRLRGESWDDFADLFRQVRYEAFQLDGTRVITPPTFDSYLNIWARPI